MDINVRTCEKVDKFDLNQEKGDHMKGCKNTIYASVIEAGRTKVKMCAVLGQAVLLPRLLQ